VGVGRLREGIKWICSKCGKTIPTGEGVSIKGKAYCEDCGLKLYDRIFEVISNKMEELKERGGK